MQRESSSTWGGRVFLAVLIGLLLLPGAGYLVKRSLSRTAQLSAAARVTEVGIDPHGYWFVRVEIENTGSLPWRIVHVSNAHVVSAPPVAVEVGSTLPNDEVPERFDVIIEAVDEDVVPESASDVTFDLGIVSDNPWYLASTQVRRQSFFLPL